MFVVNTISELKAHRHQEPGKTWGFVPTMGFLHEGHLSLVRQALQENDACCVSIFVNAAQFNNPADFNTYPVDLDHDLALLEKAGVDLVFVPEQATIYPADFSSKVSVGELSTVLEGACRPGHFDGVTTVVCKLFNIITPQRAYFGQKDAQQLLIIQRMVADLNLDVQVVGCPIRREDDGLAMSSRNARLTAEQRMKATVLSESLKLAERMVREGERSAAALIAAVRQHIEREPLARVDLIALSHPETLAEVDLIAGEVLLSLGVFIGDVRLIDNQVIRPPVLND